MFIFFGKYNYSFIYYQLKNKNMFQRKLFIESINILLVNVKFITHNYLTIKNTIQKLYILLHKKILYFF